jgi:glycosyltransferase involved in cell wall biosynthesis
MASSAGMNDTEAQGVPNPRMTVMICVYSGEPGIRRLLQSLAAQNLPESVPYEILVVDNNSRDATRAICETFSEQNPGKLRLLTERQQG